MIFLTHAVDLFLDFLSSLYFGVSVVGSASLGQLFDVIEVCFADIIFLVFPFLVSSEYPFFQQIYLRLPQNHDQFRSLIVHINIQKISHDKIKARRTL